MRWLKSRLMEPSSWAALAAMIGTWANAFPRYELGIYFLSGICGTIAFVMKEAENGPDE